MRAGPAGTGYRAHPLVSILTVAALLALSAIVLSACTSDGLSLARQACGHVDTSVRLYTKSLHEPDPTKARHLQKRATEELEAAWPLAAAATSADPQWNPLQTTLQNIGRTSESHLLTALRAQCAQAREPNEQAPIVPATTGATTLPGAAGTAPTRTTAPTPATLPGQ